jgi:hypothetical protein
VLYSYYRHPLGSPTRVQLYAAVTHVPVITAVHLVTQPECHCLHGPHTAAQNLWAVDPGFTDWALTFSKERYQVLPVGQASVSTSETAGQAISMSGHIS